MASKNTAGRMKVIYAFLLLFGPALLLIFLSTRGCKHNFERLDDYGKANSFSFIDSRGKEFTETDFKDEIVLIACLQQSCPDSCSVNFWSFNQMLYQSIRKGQEKSNRVKIITFIVDANGNPVEDLSLVHELIQDKVKDYDPNVWYIASGDVKAAFDWHDRGKSLLQESQKELGKNPYQRMMLLIDESGHLRMIAKNTEIEGTIRTMKNHIALLQKEHDIDKKNNKK